MFGHRCRGLDTVLCCHPVQSYAATWTRPEHADLPPGKDGLRQPPFCLLKGSFRVGHDPTPTFCDERDSESLGRLARQGCWLPLSVRCLYPYSISVVARESTTFEGGTN